VLETEQTVRLLGRQFGIFYLVTADVADQLVATDTGIEALLSRAVGFINETISSTLDELMGVGEQIYSECDAASHQ